VNVPNRPRREKDNRVTICWVGNRFRIVAYAEFWLYSRLRIVDVARNSDGRERKDHLLRLFSSDCRLPHHSAIEQRLSFRVSFVGCSFRKSGDGRMKKRD
jgi:hypothetical protein